MNHKEFKKALLEKRNTFNIVYDILRMKKGLEQLLKDEKDFFKLPYEMKLEWIKIIFGDLKEHINIDDILKQAISLGKQRLKTKLGK